MKLRPMPGAETSLAAVERLRRLTVELAEGSDDGRWLAGALDRYLTAPDRVDLRAALGLATGPGSVKWWRQQKLAERDDLLRQIGEGLPGKTHARAVALQQLLRRYAATGWPRERQSKQPTAQNAILFAIFELDPDPPTGIRQLTTILDP